MPKTALISRQYLRTALQSAAAHAHANPSARPTTYQQGLQTGYARAMLAACDILNKLEDAPRRSKPVLLHKPESHDQVPLTPGYVSRTKLDEQLGYALLDNGKKVIPTGADLAASIGLTLGFSDGIRAARKMLHDLEDEPRVADLPPWA